MKPASTVSAARLASSLSPSLNTLDSQAPISRLLLAQEQPGDEEIEDAEREQGQIFRIEGDEIAGLGERAEADVLEPQRRKTHAHDAACALQRGCRVKVSGEVE